MKLRTEPVQRFNCGKCGHAIDARKADPLSVMSCPACGVKVEVPTRFDHFLLLGEMGSSHVGAVYKANDPLLQRRVAIKVLRTRGVLDGLTKACLEQARELASINHGSILQVYRIGEYEDQPYIVMPLLDGPSTRELTGGQPLSEQRALDLALQVAEGLQVAHDAGLVHMDIRPDGVLLDSDGNVKLADFGLAKWDPNAKKRGFIGTAGYVAPETTFGKAPDVSSDLYSLGATLYHWLIGQPPFIGDDVAVVQAKLAYRAVPIAQLRQGLHPYTAGVVDRLLAMQPNQRPASAGDLADDLRATIAAVQGREDGAASGMLIAALPAGAPAPAASNPVSDAVAALASAQLASQAAHEQAAPGSVSNSASMSASRSARSATGPAESYRSTSARSASGTNTSDLNATSLRSMNSRLLSGSPNRPQGVNPLAILIPAIVALVLLVGGAIWLGSANASDPGDSALDTDEPQTGQFGDNDGQGGDGAGGKDGNGDGQGITLIPEPLPKPNPALPDGVLQVAKGLKAVPAAQTRSALVAHWDFDEVTGSTIEDLAKSASNRDGQLMGGPATTAIVQGRHNKALKLDGVKTFVTVKDFSITTNTLTVTAWVRLDGPQRDSAGIVFSRRGTASATGLNTKERNLLAYHWRGDSKTWQWQSGIRLPAKRWYFVALTIRPNQAVLYRSDGEGGLLKAINQTSHAVQTIKVLDIGQDRHQGNRFFKGTVDDVRVYNRALTDGEVKGVLLAGNR